MVGSKAPTRFPTEGWSRSLGANSNPSPVLGSTAQDLALSGEVGGPAGMYAPPTPGARKWRCGQYHSLRVQGGRLALALSPAGRVLPVLTVFSRLNTRMP